MVGGRRWYPTVEALEDGSVVIIGGNQWGGYASGAGQDNPTYEFWPPRGDSPVDMSTFLGERTRPLDMYPLTWLMKSGRLFLQAAYAAILWDLDSASEVVTLPDIPKAARVYPASAGVAMLPMTPANNYEQTVLFCGGVERALEEFGSDAGPAYNPIPFAASKSCERITPEADNANWTKDDDLITGRSMGTFVYLPDGKLWFAQGAQYGTAGYSKQTYNAYMNQSLGDDPEYQPYLYDPYAPSGQRFSTKGLSNSTVPRLYHSSALLLEDGSVMSAGSNPNTDVTTSHWPTEYRVEKWYPLWYSEQRPSKLNITQLLYGGGFFDVPLSSSDLSNNITNIQTAKVVIIRNGFATHGVNWGMRYLELNSTYTADQNGGSNGTLHVSNMPGSEHQGPNIFQPGPAMAFLVVNGIPSYGQHIMVGNGKIGNQRATTNANLPPNQDPPAPQQSVAAGNSQRAGEKTGSNASASGSGSGSGSSGADHLSQKVGASLLAAALVGATALL